MIFFIVTVQVCTLKMYIPSERCHLIWKRQLGTVRREYLAAEQLASLSGRKLSQEAWYLYHNIQIYVITVRLDKEHSQTWSN